MNELLSPDASGQGLSRRCSLQEVIAMQHYLEHYLGGVAYKKNPSGPMQNKVDGARPYQPSPLHINIQNAAAARLSYNLHSLVGGPIEIAMYLCVFKELSCFDAPFKGSSVCKVVILPFLQLSVHLIPNAEEVDMLSAKIHRSGASSAL